MVGEGRDAEVVVKLATVPIVPAAGAGEQCSCRVRRRAGLAKCRPLGSAGAAAAAGRDERQDRVVSGGDARHALTAGDHLARGLVAEDHRHDPRPGAVDHGEVGVAEAGGAHAQEDFARARRVEAQLDDLQRPRLGVGPRQPHLAQHGPADRQRLMQHHRSFVARRGQSRRTSIRRMGSARLASGRSPVMRSRYV